MQRTYGRAMSGHVGIELSGTGEGLGGEQFCGAICLALINTAELSQT